MRRTSSASASLPESAPCLLAPVRRAIADIDAMLMARRQSELAAGQAGLTKQMAETVKSSHSMHLALAKKRDANLLN